MPETNIYNGDDSGRLTFQIYYFAVGSRTHCMRVRVRIVIICNTRPAMCYQVLARPPVHARSRAGATQKINLKNVTATKLRNARESRVFYYAENRIDLSLTVSLTDDRSKLRNDTCADYES